MTISLSHFRLLGGVFLWLIFAPPPVSSLHSTFCIRLPQDSIINETAYEMFSASSDTQPIASPGIEKFPKNAFSRYAHRQGKPDAPITDGKKHPMINYPYLQQDLTKLGGLELYVVPLKGRARSKEPLVGWYRIVVSAKVEEAFTLFFKSFVLFAVDNQFNVVGSWEYDAFPFGVESRSNCPATDATKHMIIPCGGVSKYETIPSNMVIFVRNNSKIQPDPEFFPTEYKADWPIVPAYDTYDLNFYFRYNIMHKGKQHRLFFRIYAEVDENYPYLGDFAMSKDDARNKLISTGAWFELAEGTLPGGSDHLPSDRSSLQCTDQMRSGRKTANNVGGWQEQSMHTWNWFVTKMFAEPQDEFNADTSLGQASNNNALKVVQKTGCAANFFGGRCNGSYCATTHMNPSNLDPGVHSDKTRRPGASFSMIPQVRSKKWGNCEQCGSGRDNAMTDFFCFPDMKENATHFNNEDHSFPNCLDHYKELTKGARCNMTKEEAENITIKVIRRIPPPKQLEKITYANGSVVTTTTGETKLKDDKHIIDRRGVTMYGIGAVLYTVRKGHGAMMLIAGMFCIPVSIFVSRYFKETFMKKRLLYARIWFQIHLQLTFWMVSFTAAGLLLSGVGSGFLGDSLHPYGIMHRILGWITVVLMLIIFLTGGIRWFSDPGLKITIMAHWALGYTLYFFSMLSIISSIHVPGSPIAQADKSQVNAGLHEAKFNKIYVLITFWILFELVIHVTLSFMMRQYDRWMQVEAPRMYLPWHVGVPIPVLKENSDQDASGTGVRMIAFWLYIGICALMTVLMVGLMMKSKGGNPDKGFGPMKCTHELNNSLDASRYAGVKYQFRKSVDPNCFYFEAD